MRKYRYIAWFVVVIMAMALSSCSFTRHNHHPKSKHKPKHEHVEKKKDHHHPKGHLPKHRRKLIEEAETWLGTPYHYAHDTKGEGTDCSGMVMQVYLSTLDYALPRNSAKQAEFCVVLKEEEVQAGDLVFFATGKDPNKVSHVGIVVDEDNFIHASSSKGVVISKLSNPWYAKRLLMYGRVPQIAKLEAHEKEGKSTEKSTEKSHKRKR